MTALARKVRRVAASLVVTLYPPDEIEVREKRRRTGYRVTLSQLHTILAMRAAGIHARGRKARRIA